jgi:lipopolysaccharide export system protein LptA
MPDQKPAPAAPAKDGADTQAAPTNTGLIANDRPVMAKAQEMTTWDKNRKIRYNGDAVLWQGATRVQGREIYIERDTQKLEARGSVVTRVPDSRQTGNSGGDPAAPNAAASPQAAHAASHGSSDSSASNHAADPPTTTKAPTYSVVSAPEFTYDGATKQGFYRENAHLVRNGLDVRSRFLHVYFADYPTANGGTETRLEHLEADVSVELKQDMPGRQRIGHCEHAEYYPDEERMILTSSGNDAEVDDPIKGTTRGPKVTWYSREDRMLVESSVKKERLQSKSFKQKKAASAKPAATGGQK